MAQVAVRPREWANLKQNAQPVKAPTHAVSVKAAADRAFMLSGPTKCDINFYFLLGTLSFTFSTLANFSYFFLNIHKDTPIQ